MCPKNEQTSLLDLVGTIATILLAHSQDPNILILANFAKEVSSSYSNSKFVAESRVGLIRASTWSHMWSEISIL